MPVEEKIILKLAIEAGWLSLSRIEAIRRILGKDRVAPGPVETWQVIPMLMESGELTLEQVETLAAKAAAAKKQMNPAALSENSQGIPVNEGDRYRIEEFLGAGGMSEVYKAYDHKLQRYVALKKLKAVEDELNPRFLREARLQAKIDHDNICKVFDIGRLQGQWYIAMTYIPGRNLKQIAGELRLEEKVKLIQEVADALHAAHRLGLVHRDVKPANIMVESSEDGRLKPYITDFGLVRDINRKDMTMTHDMVGSPCYMAPEQLTGAMSKVDRRTDVYGLGVTLYDLLSGTLPFTGENMAHLAVQILQQEPRPLRLAAPAIPLDLETIVMKCLEKDPNRRYGSARELAEDLGRYLNGEPILARRYTLAQRWAKTIRKHKTLAIVSAGAAAAVLILLGLWLRAQWRSRTAAEAASRFGQDVQEMNSIMRFAYLVPPHDIRPDRERVKAKIAEIEKKMKDLGKVADGPGNYALGQGCLALRDYPQARKYLDLAWKNGFQTPEAAYALGATLGELYQIEVRKAERITDKDLRKEVGKQLEGEYVGPALHMLAAAKAARGIPVGSAEALIDYYKKNYSSSLQKIFNFKDTTERFYEAKLLEGNILQTTGYNLFISGNAKDAFAAFEKSLGAYQEAIKTGRSDPMIYVRISELLEKMASCERLTKDQKTEEFLDKGIDYCQQAIAIDPELPAAYTVKVNLHILQAIRLGQKKLDNTESLNHCVEASQKVIDLAPDDDYNHYIAGKMFKSKFQWGKEQAESRVKTLQQSADHLKKALVLNPNNILARMDLTWTLMYKADQQFSDGQDPGPSIEQAISNYSPLLKEYSNFAEGYSVLGSALYYKFYYGYCRGKEDWLLLQEALNCYKKAGALNPDVARYQYIYGLLLANKAQFENEFGKDPRPLLEEALRMEQRALNINPDNPYIFIDIGFIRSEMAYYQVLHGQDPGSELAESDKWLKKARSANLNSYEMYHPLLMNEHIRTRYAYWLNQSPEPYVNSARKVYQDGLARYTEYLELYHDFTMTLIVQAMFQLKKGVSPTKTIAEARNVLQKTIAMKPDYFLSYQHLAEVSLVEARHDMQKNINPESAFDRAQKEIETSLHLNPHSARAYLTKAEWCYWKSQWEMGRKKAADAIIDTGLNTIEQSLKYNPDNAETYIMKGMLLQAKANTEKNQISRKNALASAIKMMLKGYAINPFLKK